jgi:hypothetical protein
MSPFLEERRRLGQRTGRTFLKLLRDALDRLG